MEKRPFLMLIIGIFGISLSSIFARLAEAPPAVTAAYRLIFTVLLLSPTALGKQEHRKEIKQMSRKNFLLSVLSGVFLAAHFTVWFEALRHTSVASATTIVCTEVIWVALGFCLFMKGRITWKAAAAIGVAVVGSVMIALSDSGASGGHLYGDILALLAAFASATYTLIGQRVRKTTSTTAYTYVVYVACCISLLLFCLLTKENLLVHGWRAPVFGFALALFSTILGHSIFSWCLKYFSPSFVSASKLCEPVVASVIAVFLFSELPKLLQIAGGVLILGGVYYYSRLERKQQ